MTYLHVWLKSIIQDDLQITVDCPEIWASLVGQNPPANAGDLGSLTGSGRPSREGNTYVRAPKKSSLCQ